MKFMRATLSFSTKHVMKLLPCAQRILTNNTFSFGNTMQHAVYLATVLFVVTPMLLVSVNIVEFEFVNFTTFFVDMISAWLGAVLFFFSGLYLVLNVVCRAAVYGGTRLMKQSEMLVAGQESRTLWVRTKVRLLRGASCSLRVVGYKTKVLVFALCVILSIWALYLPLTAGLLDGFHNSKPQPAHFFAGLAAGGVALFFFAHRKAVFVVILIGPFILSVASLPKWEKHAFAPIPVSTVEPNVLVISFDALQSRFIEQVIAEDDARGGNLRAALDGFVLFPDVLAVAPTTILSTAVTKTGYLPNTIDYAAPENQDFITYKLTERGFKTETLGDFSRVENEKTHKLSSAVGVREYNYHKALRVTFLRAWSSVATKIVKLTAHWHGILQFLLPQGPFPFETKLGGGLKRGAPAYDSFVEKLADENSKGTVRFHHYLFTHTPFRFQADCTRVQEPTTSLTETTCALNKMVSLIEKLKALGAYDNSVVFFTSDHGYQCGQANPSSFAVENYRVSQSFCLSRYTPFLMVKPLHASQPLAYSARPASLLDIPKTTCHVMLGNDKACDTYEGYDLFSAEPPDAKHSRYVLIAENPTEQRMYEDFTHVEIGRHRTLADYYVFDPTSILLQGAYLSTNFGQPTATGTMISNGRRRGRMTFGPYWNLPAGRYRLEIEYRYDNGEESAASKYTTASFDVVANFGNNKLLPKQSLAPSPPNTDEFITKEFFIESEQRFDNLELRTYFGGRGELEIGHLRVTKLGATSDSPVKQ